MGVKEDQEQSRIFYLVAMMLVQVISFLLTYLVLRFQNYLPLNPQNFPGVPPALAFNTAVSFTTTTNW
jgi:potassium-transporting ATPase potassium-binding subunit